MSNSLSKVCLLVYVHKKGLRMYGGNTPDASAHTPAPEVMTHLTINNAYFVLVQGKD